MKKAPELVRGFFIQNGYAIYGFLGTGFLTGGFFGAAFSFGRSSAFTLALSQCSMNAGSGSYEARVPETRTGLPFSSFAASGWPATFHSMFGVEAASNSASLVTNAVFITAPSEVAVTSSIFPGTSGKSAPHTAAQVTLDLSPPDFRSVTTEAMVMSLRAVSRSALLKSW